MTMLGKTGLAYFLAIAHFFYRSAGFVKFYDELYVYWKCIPVAVLILFVTLHGGGLPTNKRVVMAIALVMGCIGDYFIGLEHHGIVPGAVVFGIGHLCYLSLFVHDTTKILWPLAAVLLSYNAVMGHVCITPVLKVSVLNAAIMSVYSLIFTATLIIAASQCVYGSTKHPAFSRGLLLRTIGFAIFYLSDSTLILDHTGFEIPNPELIILATYFSAQFLFVAAAVTLEKQKVKKAKAK